MNYSLGWVGWLLGDTALVGGDLDVSLISPGGTPRVLDEEVLLTVLGSVSDGEDTVVESGSASGGDDTTVVSLEDVLVGLDGDGNWSLGEGSLELSDTMFLDILVGSDGTNTLRFVVVAGSIPGGVGVVRLKLEWVTGLDVSEGHIHEATLASVVSESSSTVHELLLRERFELSVFLEVGSLNGTGGGE